MGKGLTQEAVLWRASAAALARLALRRSGLDDAPIPPGEKFSVDFTFFWRDKRGQFDADNSQKVVFDALNKVVWPSDKHGLGRSLDFFYDEAKPRIELLVSYPPTRLVELEA